MASALRITARLLPNIVDSVNRLGRIAHTLMIDLSLLLAFFAAKQGAGAKLFALHNVEWNDASWITFWMRQLDRRITRKSSDVCFCRLEWAHAVFAGNVAARFIPRELSGNQWLFVKNCFLAFDVHVCED